MVTEHYANSIKIIGPNVFKTIEYNSWYLIIFLYHKGSQSVVPGPAMTELPGKLWELQTLGPCPRATNSETLRVALAICVLTSPPGDSDIGSCLGTTALPTK